MPSAQSLVLPQPRVRHTTHTSRSSRQTNAEKQEKAGSRRAKQAEMNEEVRRWKASTLEVATDLARRFNKKPRYFLDLFFQGGVRLVRTQKKANPHNAYMQMKADVLRDQGETPTLDVLHSKELRDEYDALTEAELQEIVENHEETTSDRYLKRPSASAREQDVTCTLNNMRAMLQSLNMRVGVEGFFCVVRNTPDYSMEPIWYFTSTPMKEYMPVAVPVSKGWDYSYVGAKLEAFAIAGCDTINLNRTSKQKADDMKRQIREKINRMLTTITKNETATMQYVNYEELIVQRYGVELVGWTYDKLVSPSELSTSLPGLRKLLDAINNGDCKFTKLTAIDLRARRAEYEKKIDDGIIPGKSRKERKDRGVKRKHGKENLQPENKTAGDGDGDGGSQKAKHRRKGPRSKEIIESEDENGDTSVLQAESQ